jgi:hypothetical protein
MSIVATKQNKTYQLPNDLNVLLCQLQRSLKRTPIPIDRFETQYETAECKRKETCTRKNSGITEKRAGANKPINTFS